MNIQEQRLEETKIIFIFFSYHCLTGKTGPCLYQKQEKMAILGIERVKSLQCPFLRTSGTQFLNGCPEDIMSDLELMLPHATSVNANHCIIIFRVLGEQRMHLANAGGNEDTKNPIQAKKSGQSTHVLDFKRLLALYLLLFTFGFKQKLLK